MGQHRNEVDRRRGVSRGLILTVLAVAVVAALVVGWVVLGNRLTQDGDSAANACAEGPETVTVISDPDLAAPLAAIATEFGKTRPVVRDKCITVQVKAGDPKVTLDGLTGTWDPASMGPYPAAWVPASSIWSAQLLASASSVVEGTPRSLVTSPVVLAVAPQFATTVGGKLSWLQLLPLQRNDDGLAELGLEGWGRLRIGFATGSDLDAGVLAAQAVATEITHTDSAGLTTDDTALPQVVSTIKDLRKRAVPVPDGSAARALPIIAGPSPASADIQAIPMTEQALYAATRGANPPQVVGLLPSGVTPMADYPVVDLTGPKVSAAQAEAVTKFFDFTRLPEQLRRITSLGFRGNAALPAANTAVSFPVTANPMAAPDPAASVAITDLMTRR
ncbi:substrate-binding domain-containing protein [Williamsia sp. CHRR-6]|uniref:substrate-binding domain-containing protein n=1 Tax=Williamsia sp. CHRR-6 TaxID=2835871 RepID=UPI001BDA55F4|nr:substrate-binding domain-containing protein [Williamsia sp. CHRR-6]MBT0568213.1 substrate-binding domain-containing protein [Williamsia sp. CHRR-6]